MPCVSDLRLAPVTPEAAGSSPVDPANISFKTKYLQPPRSGSDSPICRQGCIRGAHLIDPTNRRRVARRLSEAAIHVQRAWQCRRGMPEPLSNRRVWADLQSGVPDGICLDAEGAFEVDRGVGRSYRE